MVKWFPNVYWLFGVSWGFGALMQRWKNPGEELTVRYYQNNESGNHFNTISSYQVLKNSLNELFLRDLYILYDSSKAVITIDILIKKRGTVCLHEDLEKSWNCYFTVSSKYLEHSKVLHSNIFFTFLKWILTHRKKQVKL